MAAPKAPKPKGKGTPPTSAETSPSMANNTTKANAGELVPMNFKVDSEFRKDVRTFAAIHEMSMVDVIKEAFELLKQTKGS